ncbi:unnamed protein product, partial [Timema podura]|nr:unnamed protein product [Timema podura]
MALYWKLRPSGTMQGGTNLLKIASTEFFVVQGGQQSDLTSCTIVSAVSDVLLRGHPTMFLWFPIHSPDTEWRMLPVGGVGEVK